MRALVIAGRAVAAIVLAIVFAPPTFAQSPKPDAGRTAAKPDLRGKWTLNFAKSTLEKFDERRSVKIEIAESDSRVEFRISTDGGPSDVRRYSLDGVGHFQGYGASKRFRSYYTAEWKGNALILSFRIGREGTSEAEVGSTEGLRLVELWTLSPDGRVLTRSISGNGADETEVYDKQAAAQ
jgi:hypothetical protein